MDEEELVEIPSRIFLRYHRRTQANPEGEIVHHGDCHVFRVKICTCGLIHDLQSHVEEANKIYPKYDAESAEHDKAIEKIFHPQ